MHYDAFRKGVQQALQRVAANRDQALPATNVVDSGDSDWHIETPPGTMHRLSVQQSMPTPPSFCSPPRTSTGPAAMLLRNPGTARALADSCFVRLKLNKAGCLPRSDLQLCLT